MLSVYEKMESCLLGEDAITEYYLDENWRVRYAAAVAMGETKNKKWLPFLNEILAIEDKRPLYSQPSIDDITSTRESEHIGPLENPFQEIYPEDIQEAWKCRGRVKSAVAYAVATIGEANEAIKAKFHQYLLTEGEDFSVKAASAAALGRASDASSLPYLMKILDYNEWCTSTEGKKAIHALTKE